MPRALVVTLDSFEAEGRESRASVASQFDFEIDHRFIIGAPEMTAHNSLLELFRDNVASYDVFVKVDADTIIDHPRAFSVVHAELKSANAAAAQLYLLDYFTCRYINGLNFFSPNLNDFRPSNDPLYCDRSIVHRAHHLYSDAFIKHNIIPVGRHCAYPTDKQAFHFGLHRGLKKKVEEEHLTLVAARKHKDRARTLACIGFELARSCDNEGHSYTSDAFQGLYEKALKMHGTWYSSHIETKSSSI